MPTYVRGENDRGRRKVELRDIEGLAEEIGRVELVENSRASLLGGLLLLRLSSNAHVAHTLGDTTDTRRRLTSAGCWIALIGSLITVLRSLSGGLLCSIAWVALGSGSLRLGLVTSITRSGLSSRSAVLLGSALGLATGDGVGASANLECLGRISSLLLLVVGGFVLLRLLGGGLVFIALLRLLFFGGVLAILLACVAAEAIARRRHRHD